MSQLTLFGVALWWNHHIIEHRKGAKYRNKQGQNRTLGLDAARNAQGAESGRSQGRDEESEGEQSSAVAN